MTGLLVSVRNGQEARLALEGGADLIDVKEPLRGALGAADPAIWTEVLGAVAGAVPTSVALGEVGQAGEPADIGALARFQFAKWGLAQSRRHADWRSRWTERLGRLPPGVIPVAVVYADWQRAASPLPEQIIEAAAGRRCGVVLFDTFDKQHGGLLDHLSYQELGRLTDQTRQAGLRVVFGGGLCRMTIPSVLSLRPDYVAVRGAVCRRDRTGDLDAALVRQLHDVVRQPFCSAGRLHFD
jgi:uncharacterized protein (UPF0264 family)